MSPVGAQERSAAPVKEHARPSIPPSDDIAVETVEGAEALPGDEVVGAGWLPAEPLRRKRRKVWGRLALALLGIAAVVGAYLWLQSALRTRDRMDIQLFTVASRSFPILLKEKGELKAANSIDVRSEIEGRATIIFLVDEGARVKQGDLLVELASDEIEEKLRDAEIKEATATADYEAAVKERDILVDENASKVRKAELDLKLAQLGEKKYLEGDRKQLQKDAELAVDKSKSVLQRKDQDYKDSRELFDQGFITRVELENARFEHYEAGLELTKAELALEVLNKYTIPMSLEENSSKVHEAVKELERARKAAEASESKAAASVEAKRSELALNREKLAKLKDQKAKSKIFAPADGMVVYEKEWWRDETDIKTGATVHERQTLITLPNTDSMKVVVSVHEAQVERLQVGMSAKVTIEGLAGQHFTGKISKIAVMADSQHRWLNPNLKEYETEILLDGKLSELKPGTTARVEIHITELDNVLAVPVQTVFAKAGKYYVFVDEGGKVRPVQVEPGLSSTDYVEIKSGLKENQSVRMAITGEMQLLLPDSGDHDEGEDGDAELKKGPPPGAGKP